jgi:hypothetical protein
VRCRLRSGNSPARAATQSHSFCGPSGFVCLSVDDRPSHLKRSTVNSGSPAADSAAGAVAAVPLAAAEPTHTPRAGPSFAGGQPLRRGRAAGRGACRRPQRAYDLQLRVPATPATTSSSPRPDEPSRSSRGGPLSVLRRGARATRRHGKPLERPRQQVVVAKTPAARLQALAEARGWTSAARLRRRDRRTRDYGTQAVNGSQRAMLTALRRDADATIRPVWL